MKQFFLISLLMVMVSCKSDAEKKPAEEENTKLTEVAPNDAQLLGTWVLVQQKVDGVEKMLQDSPEISFDKNNTYKGFNNQTFRFEIQKDTLLLYSDESKISEKSQLLYVNESKNNIQLTTKLVDGRVVQTQLRRKSAN